MSGIGTSYSNYLNPEISEWFVSYGGCINPTTDPIFSIYTTNFVQIYPSNHPKSNLKGKIELKRMAVDSSGTIRETNEIAWGMSNLTSADNKTN